MITDAPNLNILWAELIVEELLRCAAGDFVVSPGSRSTPLALAVERCNVENEHHPKPSIVVHYDERGAAYFAVGEAKACGRPVVLICTSGTAVANYYPAVVEAFMSQVPLIVLSADRPPELQQTGANQTIDQNRLFGTYVKTYVDLPCPDKNIPPAYLLTTIDHAVYQAKRAPAGPVHINCKFREPLAPVPSSDDVALYVKDILHWYTDCGPYNEYTMRLQLEDRALDSLEVDELKNVFENAKRPLVIVGQDAPEPFNPDPALFGLLSNWNAPVFADVASGMRFMRRPPFVPFYDLALLSKSVRARCQPDVVFHFGGRFVSKRLLEHIGSMQVDYVHIDNHPHRSDPTHRIGYRVEASISAFCESPLAELKSAHDPEWLQIHLRASEIVESVVETELKQCDALSEPAVARYMAHMLKPKADRAFFLGNSMPIRDVNMFGCAHDVVAHVCANRGASGIDGNIATAAGFSFQRKSHVPTLIGDLAALHDLSSFALLKQPGVRVTLIVVNNDGGGIFHFLPVAEHGDVFEKYFATPHGMQFEDAARMFGLRYARPATKAEFVEAFTSARESGVSSIIEVVTDREENVRLHRKISDAVVKALEDI